MHNIRMTSTIIIVLFLSACTSVQENVATSFDQIHETEQQYYKNKPAPTGLALSGGGTRSASFNIGVLAGLQEIGELNNLDSISSVSGGTYASYWYFSKLHYQNPIYETDYTVDDLFKLCFSVNEELLEQDISCKDADAAKDHSYRFQRHLFNNSLILKEHTMKAGAEDDPHWGHFVPVGLRTIIEAPISNVLELLGTDNNSAPARDYYRRGLERTYGLVPTPKNHKGVMKGSFVGDTDANRSWSGHKKHADNLYLPEIKKLYDTNKADNPPVWIINTTVAPHNDFRFTRLYKDPFEAEPFYNSIYEVSPFAIGSGTTGYMTTTDASEMKCNGMAENGGCLRTVSDYVALSGAAIDVTPYTGFGGTIGLTALSWYGIELGDYSLNPKDFTEPAYLSDGGHSDNLGAYSLIKRGFKNIIISDAESDPDGTIEGLRRLAKHLSNESKKYLNDDKKGKLAKHIKGDTRIVFYHDGKPINELNECIYNGTEQCLTIAFDGRGLDEYREAKDWELSPILEAKIENEDGIVANIFYIKLRALDAYSDYANQHPTFDSYSKATLHILNGTDKIGTFPHIGTEDINFSPVQYYAYYTLGRFYGAALQHYLND
ncbi:hypothetical protein [uncultured Vibrio sp.]|uniref:hypothetical protein n=1 Tax=uncultured Vibrio sp. TaxID=114054 RepID=UPI0026004ED0|nr:hypothetical protein [uncultured Vibrio sp.]